MSIDENKELEPEVEYSLMSGQDKASIVLSLLGMRTTQLIFKHLKDNDVKRIINTMSNIRKAPIWLSKKLLEEFYSLLNEDAALLFSENKGKDFIVNTLGEERAKQLLGQIVDVEHSNNLESLELVDTRTLANFLHTEHPQVVALIIAHLSPEKKVDVLRRLSEDMQSDVVFRIAKLDYVSPELIAQLDDVLKTELATLGSIDTNQLGGSRPIADMLNLMDKVTEKNIITKVEEQDPVLADVIRKLMFIFEDIIYVDDRGIQNLIREIEQSKLCIALKNTSDEVKNKVFSNMSNRAATLLKDDLSSMGPTKLSDVEKAQAEIIQKIRELEAQGKLFISRGEGEGADVFV